MCRAKTFSSQVRNSNHPTFKQSQKIFGKNPDEWQEVSITIGYDPDRDRDPSMRPLWWENHGPDAKDHGIVFEIDGSNEVVPYIFESFTDSQVKSAVTRLKKKYKKSWPTSKENLEKVLNSLEDKVIDPNYPFGYGLYHWFLEGVVVENDSFDTDSIGEIWKHIMTATKSKLPDARFEYWITRQGYSAACIVFEDYDLFQPQKLTAKGKKLADALGVETLYSLSQKTMQI